MHPVHRAISKISARTSAGFASWTSALNLSGARDGAGFQARECGVDCIEGFKQRVEVLEVGNSDRLEVANFAYLGIECRLLSQKGDIPKLVKIVQERREVLIFIN